MARQSPLPTTVAAAAALLLLAATVGSAQGQVDCASKPVVDKFNVSAYMGTWYEYAKFGDTPFEKGGVCVTAEYMLVDRNNVTVLNSMRENGTHNFHNTSGWADFQNETSTEAKLNVHLEGAPVIGMYWVLSTDYKSYSIVWSCKQPSQETSWILMRERSPSNMTKKEVEDELKKLNLQMDKYSLTEQSDEICSGARGLLGTVLTIFVASLLARLH